MPGRTPAAAREAPRRRGVAAGVSVAVAVAAVGVPAAVGPGTPAAAEAEDAPPASPVTAEAEDEERASARQVSAPQGQQGPARQATSRQRATTRSDRAARPGEAVPGQVLVKWASDTSPQQRANSRRAEGLSHATSLDLIGAEVATFPPERGDPAQVAARVARDGRVAYAEPNRVVRARAEPPDDPRFDRLWGLHNIGQTIEAETGTAGVDVDALDAWDTTRGDEDVTVAVIDTGTDVNHPDLEGNVWTNPDETRDGTDSDGNGYVDDVHGWDFFHDDETVFDPGESDAHGTHVSGTIAATADNGIGVAGAAPGVSVMPLKFLGPGGTGSTAGAIEAVDYAAGQGAEVVNASWGGVGNSQALRDAIDAAGMVFVAAAGNQGTDNDADPTYPCSYELAEVLCVAAVDNTGALAEFSNTGAETVDLGAPGVSVLSTVPPAPRAPVALQIADPDTGHEAMFWGFGLEEAVGEDERARLLGQALGDHLEVAGDDPVLLVDDDESDSNRRPDTRSYYTQALDQAGYQNVTVEEVPTDQPGPDAARMRGNTVVWFTGYAFGNPPDGPTTLTDQDQAELIEFLEGGGKLILAGEDATYRIEYSRLITDYLHADFRGEVTGRHAEGGPDSVYAGEEHDLTGSESPFELPSPYLDFVEPASPAATEALIFPAQPYTDAYEYFDGTSMAAPHASGVAALVDSHAPRLPASDIVDNLRGTVDALASLEGVTGTGGTVNAANALVEATPAPPGAPTDATAVAGDEQATVSWEPPADDGGAPISAYTVTSEPGGVSVTVGGDETEATVGGLVNGTTYTFTVRAVNEAGRGSASEPSDAVTPEAVVTSEPAVTSPGAPTSVAATAGDEQATVSWEPPDDDGGGAITGYTVASEPGGVSVTVGGEETEATVTGLANGTTYTFTVRAVNEAGRGPASEPSNAVTPEPRATPPGAPTHVTATGGDEAATVSWQPPADDGGAPISAYTVTTEPGGITVAAGGHETELSVGGLANGTRYAFRVTALNEVGAGPASELSEPVTPTDADADDEAAEAAQACDPDEVAPAGFTDVTEGNAHREAVACVVRYDITRGTTATTYAPEGPVRRDQMASFLARAVDASDAELPAVDQQAFDDLGGNPHADNVERLAEAGIVRGAGGDHYVPSATVTRAQMASFLARAYAFVATELPVEDPAFSDIAGSPHEDNIARVAGAGIAHGITETTYSPSRPVRRDQMASFLARTLDALAQEGRLTPR